MAVLKTISPPESAAAPNPQPRKTVPSSNASNAGDFSISAKALLLREDDVAAHDGQHRTPASGAPAKWRVLRARQQLGRLDHPGVFGIDDRHVRGHDRTQRATGQAEH